MFSKPEGFRSELATRCFLLGNWNIEPSGGLLIGDVLVELLSHDRMKATFASLSKACRSGMWKLTGEEQVVTFLQDSILNHVLGGTKNPKSLVMLYLKYSSIALPKFNVAMASRLFWFRSFNV